MLDVVDLKLQRKTNLVKEFNTVNTRFIPESVYICIKHCKQTTDVADNITKTIKPLSLIERVIKFNGIKREFTAYIGLQFVSIDSVHTWENTGKFLYNWNMLLVVNIHNHRSCKLRYQLHVSANDHYAVNQQLEKLNFQFRYKRFSHPTIHPHLQL